MTGPKMASSEDTVTMETRRDLGNRDPVAANLAKVIHILNKHKLADGLDLRYLRDSIGFEQDANEKKVGGSEVGVRKVAGKVLTPRIKVRRPVGDKDGSYLGQVGKADGSGMINMKGTNNARFATDTRDTNNMSGTTNMRGMPYTNGKPNTNGMPNTSIMTNTNGTTNTRDTTGTSSSIKPRQLTSIKPQHPLSIPIQGKAEPQGISPTDSGRGSSQKGSDGTLTIHTNSAFSPPEPKCLIPSVTNNSHPVAKDNQISCHGDVTMDGLSSENLKVLNVKPSQRHKLTVDLNDNDVHLVTDPAHGAPGNDSGNHGDLTDSNRVVKDTAKAGNEDFKTFYWKIEVEEWSRVNRQLRQHGLPPVDVLHPRRAAKLSDTVVLEPETAHTLRNTLNTLMKDCDRRQGLVQELIVTNNQLRSPSETPSGHQERNELGEQTTTTQKYENRARELKTQLDNSLLKVDELEEDRLLHSDPRVSEEERLRNTKKAVQARCRELQKQVEDQRLEIDTLRAQLEHARLQDQNLKRKHEEALLRLKKQVPKNARIDDKTLDVIDSYERQIYALRRELAQRDDPGTVSEEATPNYKGLIKSYERDSRDAAKKVKKLENENQLLRLDLQGRPELKDFRTCQQRVKKLERLLREHNIRPEASSDRLAFSTHLEDIDYLPATQCQRLLREACEQLDVDDVEQLAPALRHHQRALTAQPRLAQFAEEVLELTQTQGVPVPTEFTQRHRPSRPHEVWCDKTMHHVLPTLEHWVLQLKALKELQAVLVELTAVLSPGGVTGLDADPPSTTKLITAVRSLLSDNPGLQNGHPSSRDAVSRAVLQGIVDHFMTLFDVGKVSGVYARMNDVYSKLGEVHNTLKTLRAVLNLAEDVRGAAVVDAVARLVQTQNRDLVNQLRHLLNVDDLQSVVTKLQEHEEFFPVFKEVMSKLMEICGCKRMDQVIPTVRALKLLAG